MNPFLLPISDRLANWRDFRRSLKDVAEPDVFQAVADYWAKAPLVSIAYDPSDASNWPNPWEMMAANEWCRGSVAIGMESTLRLAGFTPDRMSLQLFLDRDIEAMLLVLAIDREWVLNYDWGFVRPYPNTDHTILRSWKFSGKNYCLLDN